MSAHRSGAVRSMTLVKLTTSLAAVSAAIAARAAILVRLPSDMAAAVPSIAPSPFAPASPSIDRSARSSGRSAPAAASGAAVAGPSAPPATSRAPATPATLMARPGRRSKRFRTLAPPAIRPALMTMSAAARARRRPGSAALSSALAAINAATTPVTPMPTSLTAPVVSSPWDSAPMWPRNPRWSPLPFTSS